MRRLRQSYVVCLTVFSLLIFTACSTLPDFGEPLEFDDPQVRAHWIKESEAAPFDGLLLNEYTYYRLRMALIECEVNR